MRSRSYLPPAVVHNLGFAYIGLTDVKSFLFAATCFMMYKDASNTIQLRVGRVDTCTQVIRREC